MKRLYTILVIMVVIFIAALSGAAWWLHKTGAQTIRPKHPTTETQTATANAPERVTQNFYDSLIKNRGNIDSAAGYITSTLRDHLLDLQRSGNSHVGFCSNQTPQSVTTSNGSINGESATVFVTEHLPGGQMEAMVGLKLIGAEWKVDVLSCIVVDQAPAK